MKPLPFSLPCLLGLLLAGPALADDEEARLLAEARQATQQLLQQIGGELRREYELSGSIRSVVVCKYTAPEVSSNISRKYGAEVKRVSLRVRNPSLGTPDAWEQKVLMEFDRRLARGEKADQIDFAETVKEPMGSYFRYMRAIPTGELCLNCHGTKDTLTAATQSQLAAEYPHDRATGYAMGQVRGAVTFKKLR
jgi:hypothetical protein